MIALLLDCATATCTGTPRTLRRNHMVPVWARVMVPPVGSGIRAGIGAIAAQQRRQRAIASALFLGDGLEIDIGAGLVAGAAQRLHGEAHGGHTRLHVIGAAPVEPAILHRAAIGREVPHFGRPSGTTSIWPWMIRLRPEGHALHGVG